MASRIRSSKSSKSSKSTAAIPKSSSAAIPKSSTAALPKGPLRCREVMRRPVHAIPEGENVLVAARIMREMDVGILPVCDEKGAVVGVLTDRDIATRVCAAATDPAKVRTGAVMTRAALTCLEEDPVAKAETLMRRHHVTRIVITSSTHVPVGILSLSDLAQYERPAKVGRTLQTVAERKYAPERP